MNSKYLLLIALLISGCGGSNTASIDQENLCTYSTDEQAKQCKSGQLSFFRPATFGNEQLPLMAAAAYCDFTHQVIHTNGGVVCVFTTKRLHLLAQK